MNQSKSVYSMSEVGSCPRVIAAGRMGYEPTPQNDSDIKRLNHYTALEAVAASQIEDLGYELKNDGLCLVCCDRIRYGIHVEIDTTLFDLVGHLDRRININDVWYPVEIKSLGKSSFTKFKQSQFKAFPEYAGQECAYLTAEDKPGIYWVMERDSGESLKYVVNYPGIELKLEGFTNIDLPITFNKIEDKLNDIEVSIQSGTLPMGWNDSGSCYFCHYKYLCVKEDESDKTVKMVNNPILIEASNDYKYALELEKTAGDIKAAARDSLLQHCKQNSVEKYHVAGVSVSYRGQKTKISIDGKLLQKESPELYRLCAKESSFYDDYTIRVLKEKDV